MSKKITDVIDISGIFIAIGLIAIIGSVIRFIFTASIFNFHIIGFGIVFLIIGLIVRVYEKIKK